MNRAVKSAGTPSTLGFLATGRLAGFPVAALLGLAMTALAGFVLLRLAYGRQIGATGQGWDAARLAGVRVGRTLTARLRAVVAACDPDRRPALGLRRGAPGSCPATFS